MILWATSTSMPSRFSTTVQFAKRVSAISLVSSIEFGLITQTSMPVAEALRRIGVTLGEEIFGCLDAAAEEAPAPVETAAAGLAAVFWQSGLLPPPNLSFS